jgi:kumamolisin
VKVRYRLLGALAASLPALTMVVAAPAIAAQNPQNPSTRIELRNNVAPGVAGRIPTGTVASGKRMSLTVGLAVRDQAGLNAFVAAVSDPRSPLYRHYLTVHEFAARYGASPATIDAVTSYLRSAGLKVAAVYANHLAVGVTGTAAQVEKAFGVTLHTYHDAATKRDFYANTTDPTLPASIASSVVSVAGLSSYAVRQPHYKTAKVSPGATAHATSNITPAKARGAYNLTSSISSGYDGSGETIGLVEFSAYEASDVAEYDSYYGLGATAATVVDEDGGTTDTSGDVEDELDIEVDYALAPGATIDVYEAPNSDAGEEADYAALVSNDVNIISTSWGEAEDEESSADMSSDNSDFEEAASQGQSVYAASGDSGAYDDGSTLSVDFPASDPYVTGVGGTTLTVTSADAWKSETAWSDSGGGYSSDYSTPSYQTSVNSTGQRAVPDVAADADPDSGWYIYSEGSWQEVGGTSAAAPNWAAFTADYDTAASDLSGSAFGYANSFIYSVAESSLYTSVFHEITSGSNGYYSAAAGYNEVTGWGSYNGGAFIADEL